MKTQAALDPSLIVSQHWPTTPDPMAVPRMAFYQITQDSAHALFGSQMTWSVPVFIPPPPFPKSSFHSSRHPQVSASTASFLALGRFVFLP